MMMVPTADLRSAQRCGIKIQLSAKAANVMNLLAPNAGACYVFRNFAAQYRSTTSSGLSLHPWRPLLRGI